MTSPKYNRTPHLPWSPGKSSDDKTILSVEALLNTPIIITEKMDGGNCSLEREGLFARSHSGPPTHPSFDLIKSMHAALKYSLPKGYQFFGEVMTAKHSIYYDKLPGYFLLFGIRDLFFHDRPQWLSWEKVAMWAEELKLPYVPVLWQGSVSSSKELEDLTTKIAKEPSLLGEAREGVVLRIADGFEDERFGECVAKWVRAGHVATDEHWSHQEFVKNGLAQ
jgi:hypothetical protein